MSIMMKERTEVTKDTLPEGISLEIRKAGELVFHSRGKWLYPLFEVEEFLDKSGLTAGELELHDRIAGRAAASLICRMGFGRCRIDTISGHALAVFEKEGVHCVYETLVEKILCKTEDIISADMDLDEVYALLKRRAGLIQGVDLDIRNLKAGYDGKTVLDGLELNMKAGELLVVTGDNGAGKSTLMKSIVGILPVQGGEIRLGEAGRNGNGGSSGIAYVNQAPRDSNFPVSAREIVEIGCVGRKLSSSARKHEVEIAMRRTGCFALGDRNFHTLSGGEKQRVSLARCLCQKAGLILLDEPTSFLDADSKDEFLDLLDMIAKNHLPTMILVSHDHEWIARLGWPVRELKEGRLC
jgi:zinc transport system ATP-binding protein